MGARMLERIRLWSGVARIVLHHHERCDGLGYPEGLAADAIPIEARIIAVCEAFDVMVSDSSYKIAMNQEEALAELAACSGEQFDSTVVNTFASLVEREVIQAINS
jgi:HD-GYP domain-containing protein (c-di-GMP phosphodiesterase class II)